MLLAFLRRCPRTAGDVLAALGAEVRPMEPGPTAGESEREQSCARRSGEVGTTSGCRDRTSPQGPSTSSQLRTTLRPRAHFREDLPLGRGIKTAPCSAELQPRQESSRTLQKCQKKVFTPKTGGAFAAPCLGQVFWWVRAARLTGVKGSPSIPPREQRGDDRQRDLQHDRVGPGGGNPLVRVQ